MKITLLIIYPTDITSNKIGGAETFLRGLIKYSPDNINIEFIGISSGGNKNKLKEWNLVKIGNKHIIFYPLFFEKDENKKTLIPLSLRFTMKLKRMKLDLSNRVVLFNRIEPAWIFLKIKVPKIVIIHSDIQNQILNKKSEVFWSKIPSIYLIFEKKIFSSVDFIYTVNKNTLDFYKNRYYNEKDKFDFLPTWVDSDIFRSTQKEKIFYKKSLSNLFKGLSPNKKWILFVGRLQKEKAPLRTIEAFWEYCKKDKGVKLIIIGEGNLKSKVKRLIRKLGIEENVSIFNSMTQKNLANFYLASEVLLLTSNSEGMPMCVLEALACGLPVVSTDVGEVKRVVKNGYSGEVVKDFSPKSIAQALKKVLENYQNYSKENCVNSVSEYTPQKVLAPLYQKIEELYRKYYG